MKKINHLYVHVPFCKNKCDYCAFYSHPSPNLDLIEKYIEKLKDDVTKSVNDIGELNSIFIGGGTPSYLSSNQLKRIFELLLNKFTITRSAEITIECNPESLSTDKISIISDYANRVSLGIQSFSEKKRKILGRQGSLKNIDKIISTFTKKGIKNLSADLIYGIPGQTLKDWEEELNQALLFPFKHLSAYSLTYEEGTKLSEKHRTVNSEEDLSSEMWKQTKNIIKSKNFHRYEVSNYAIPGYECRHNLNTWFGGSYIGLGPVASSFNKTQRWTNPHIDEWLNNLLPEIDKISNYERIVEVFIMGLRTSVGWQVSILENGRATLKSQFGQSFTMDKNQWNLVYKKIQQLKIEGLLFIENSENNSFIVKPTEKGMLFWNEIGLALI